MTIWTLHKRFLPKPRQVWPQNDGVGGLYSANKKCFVGARTDAFPHGAKQPFGSGFAQIGMGRWRFANLAQINQQGRDLRNRDRGGGGYTSTFASRRETLHAQQR